jgi:hypothetical protein
MDDFIEYQTFQKIENALEIIEILDSNNIPYQIDDSASRFHVIGFGESLINKIALQIRKSDIEKVSVLIRENQTDEDHYLYTFSDKDIIDVIVNPNDWSSHEISIAQNIFKQRKLILSADEIKNARWNKENSNKIIWEILTDEEIKRKKIKKQFRNLFISILGSVIMVFLIILSDRCFGEKTGGGFYYILTWQEIHQRLSFYFYMALSMIVFLYIYLNNVKSATLICDNCFKLKINDKKFNCECGGVYREQNEYK